MIKGKQKIILTREDILKRVSTYDIYRFYQGEFEPNKPCINWHRGEKDPSLIIGTKVSMNLTHKDLGDYNWRGDCFHFVQQVFRCDFPTALRIIDKDFGLGLCNGKAVDRSPIITWQPPKIELRRPPLIQVIYYRKMGKRHMDFWSRLGQGEIELKRENIFQPKEIWRNKRKVPMNDLLTFCYFYPEIEKWKIYRPFAPKRDLKTPVSQWKWDTNVPFNYVDNLKAITPDCKRAFLAKSKKDRMVLMTDLQTDCIADVPAEDPACLSQEALDKFLKVEDRWVVSDNDKKGKEFSWWLTREHGFKHLNVPDKYLLEEPKSTDFADLRWNYGPDRGIEHFKNKGLL